MPHSSPTRPTPEALVRPIIRRLQPYVPGEQPKIRGLIKLNTNENPYGPAPRVLDALSKAIDGRLRLYPNPTAERLREKLAQLHGCSAENIIVGNGSDELLALATRAFVEPLTGLTDYALKNGPAPRLGGGFRKRGEVERVLTPSRYVVQYFHPSYSLYSVLAGIHGAWPKPIPLGKDFSLPSPDELEQRHWDPDAALTFITTPNAPSGRGYSRQSLDELCRAQRGVVVLDEAYVDFSKESALELSLKHPHVLTSRTFSKAYSLCALRVGYFVGHPELIGALHRIRDSYNVNALAQVAAEASLGAMPYYRENFQRIIQTREALSSALLSLGFEVCPSQANFIFVRPPRLTAEAWLQQLRDRKVLVRWFGAPDLREYLRITIGSEKEVAALLRAAKEILSKRG
jgi:histidinol-phosphate aminotransferase